MRTVIRAIAPTRAKKAKTISIQPRISFGRSVQRSQPKRPRSPAQLSAGIRRRYEGLWCRMLREILTHEPSDDENQKSSARRGDARNGAAARRHCVPRCR
jgi:hypothetical protein